MHLVCLVGCLAFLHVFASAASWKLQVDYSGKTFFDGYVDAYPLPRLVHSHHTTLSWYFFNQSDPSNGLVNYQDRGSAFSKGLAFWTKDGIPGIQADGWTDLQPGQKRDSIRIHSNAVFNGGLFIADFKLMPWGCGIWPSCRSRTHSQVSIKRSDRLCFLRHSVWTLGYGGLWPTLVSRFDKHARSRLS